MKNPEIRRVQFYLPLLKDLPVTGNDVPPAIEGSSYGTEHLGFLRTGKGQLTGKIEILVNEIEEVVNITSGIPGIEVEVMVKEETIWVLPHRIKICLRQKPKKKGDTRVE